MKERLLALVLMIAATVATAADASFPVEPAPEPKVGVLRLGSAPLNCRVRIEGRWIEKTEPVLVFNAVPVGRHTFVFEANRRWVVKTVEVTEDGTSDVFGNLMIRGGQRLPVWRTTPTEPPNPDAQLYYDTAEILREAVNPFRRNDRYEKSEGYYRQILERWPQCTLVVDCHYRLGNILESVLRRDYAGALEEYETALALHPATELPVRWRIAVLHELMEDFTSARVWYERCADENPDPQLRRDARVKAEALRRQGY